MFLRQFEYSQILAVLFFILSILTAQADNSKTLIEQAKKNKLHESDYWHSLLHYDRTVTGYKSVVDDPKYFLSLTGKSDPLAELTATIEAFCEGDPKDKNHPVNRFPARLAWLLEQLPQAKRRSNLTPTMPMLMYF